MENNLVLLLLLAPFVGFLFNVFFGKKVGKSLSGAIGTLAVATSFGLSLYFFSEILGSKKPIEVSLFDWIQVSNFKLEIGFLLDQF